MMQDLITERWEDFLKRYCWNELIELSNSYPEKRSLFVKFSDMDIYDPNIADMLLEDPDAALEAATRALREMDIPTGVTLDEANLRIIKVPRKVKIRDIRSIDIGKLVSIEGLVTKATEVRPRVVEAVFECPFCGHIFSVEQSGRQFKEPGECERESGGCGRKVQRFKLLVDKCKFANAQKIRLQESPEELRGGELPQAIDVNLEDDISGEVSPGDRIIVIGILRSYQRSTQFGKTPFFDIYLDGNSLEIMEEEFEEIEITEEDEREIMELKNQPDVYEKLIRSIAPSIYGYEEIKEAMVLQLFAGIPKELPDETRVRGDIHLLLVGDPGVAKSQLLTYLVKLAPRGLYTGGKSSTSAGLTAAAVRDEFGEGRWTLEAGALVLADKGIAAVDEIDKMRKEDRDALHEAMEQQTVSIAKAGIMARLNSRCALLAAANPKYGRFDKYTAISEQINMPPTLMSRFDLIFTMMDRPNEEIDTKTAEHILETHYAGELHARLENKGKVEEAEREHFGKAMQTMEPAVPVDLLRKYVAWSKRNVFPVMTEEAKNKFLEFYIGLRRQGYEDEDAPVPVTARQLEALIRLGEARARTRLSDKITAEDAERVINVVTYCLKHVFVDPETGKLDTDWITVGTTKTRRDRARSIREIIKELEKEYGDEVPIEEVLDLAEEEGMEREKAEDIIEVMKRDGILFSPGSGVIKFVR
ncbi:MAG: minichromosome maintenance protein MCM [Methanophagales archaeon]|nr:minichromosome maintenance protein MCM [Methanophagales archaeon]MCW3141161.1 minichromosome maintenance protein MCM [Methanophagales archaeon]